MEQQPGHMTKPPIKTQFIHTWKHSRRTSLHKFTIEWMGHNRDAAAFVFAAGLELCQLGHV